MSLVWLLYGCGVAPIPTPGPKVSRPPTPAPIAAPPMLVMGEYGGYCLLLRGSVFCGDIRFGTPLAKGPPVGGFDDVVQVELKRDFLCVVRKGGAAHCTGNNRKGQLGAGRREPELKTWSRVLALGPVRSLALGPETACAVESTGRVACWGDNRSGQTGSHVVYAEEANELVRPSEVPLANGAQALSVIGTGSCALLPSGALTCWGEPFAVESAGHSELSELRRKPGMFEQLGTFERLAENTRGRCGITRNGAVICFGDVDFVRSEELGVALAGIPAATHIAMSETHACAVTRDGAVWCFGRGKYGVMGRDLGDSWDPVGPIRVEGLPAVASVTASTSVTCATTRAGEIHCWGGRFEGNTLVTTPPTKMRIE